MIRNPFPDTGGRWAATLGRLALLAVLGTAARITSAQAGAALPAALVGELRSGGFVIYIRHASTALVGDEQDEVMGRCETQRNLSDKGRSEAQQIGKAFRGLGIPVGTVLNSPYCRARDTATLAFGYYQDDPELGFVMGSNAEETRRRAQSLRQLLATVPARGVNSVIVSHSANLYEAAGIFAKPEGAIYVFKPLAGGRFELVARLLPEDLGEPARKTAPPQARLLGVSDR